MTIYILKILWRFQKSKEYPLRSSAFVFVDEFFYFYLMIKILVPSTCFSISLFFFIFSNSDCNLQPGSRYSEDSKETVKLGRKRRVWYLLWRVFWLLLPEFNFWKGDWALVMPPPKIEILLIFTYFVRS